jgi:hypothetical protein
VYNLMNYPALVFAVTFITLWASARIGFALRSRLGAMDDSGRGDFDVVLGATLTLLGLIIGFSFSMAISRYDQRKNYEEEEANAIGTEYFRVDLLPAADTMKIKGMLVDYLDRRIVFFDSRDANRAPQINAETAQLQSEMWSTVNVSATTHPTPLTALAVSGMNDVLNAQGYTQAAWWNRIPVAAWGLMGAIAICSNLLIGYGVRSEKRRFLLLLILPLTVSISFLLIADIDSPRGGIIRVSAQNLVSLAQSMHGHQPK